MKTPETERFLEVVERIIFTKKAKNVIAIVRKSKIAGSAISEIKAGRSGVTVQIIQKLVRAYNINSDYIVTGTGPIFANDQNQSTEIKNNVHLDSNYEIDLLKQIIEAQRQTIEALKKQIR